jgi:hypothetical protein
MFSLKKAALLAATGAFLVAPAAASANSGPKATGSGSCPGSQYQAGGVVPFSFSFNAQDVGAPKGQFTFARPDGSFTATVTAFNEKGNEAAFTGPITSGTGVFASDVGDYAYMGVQDNGQGGTANGPDGIQVDLGMQYKNWDPIYSTVSYWPAAYPYQVTSGNIQVH